MWQDPIVTEVRRVRETHAARYHYVLRSIYAALKEQEQQHPGRKVSLPPKLVPLPTEAAKSAGKT